MSMEHRAFAFDHDRFAAELAPILDEALATGDVRQLVHFIESNRARLTDPYEGEPLGEDWRSMLETEDAHQLGDFALTAYYSPRENIGLGYDWDSARQTLREASLDADAIVLGTPFGAEGNRFDPGKMGSYFQSPADVARNHEAVGDLGSEDATLSAVRRMLETADRSQAGLYVTF